MYLFKTKITETKPIKFTVVYIRVWSAFHITEISCKRQQNSKTYI